MKKLLFIVVLVFVTIAVFAGGQQDKKETVSFNFGHVMPLEHPEHLAALRMQQILSEESDGRIKMNIFPATQLGGDRELMTSLMNNTLEMACVATFGTIEPKISVVEMPYIFQDYDHIMKFIESDVQRELLDSLNRHGVFGLGYYPAGARHIGNDIQPVHNPSDLRGLLIRVYEHALLRDTITSLGAQVTVTPYSEVYMALATNQIDGEENPLVNTYAMRFHENQKYKTLTHHMDQFKIVGSSKVWWDGLSPNDQELIESAFLEAFSKYYIDLMRNSDAEYRVLLEEEGVTFIEIDDYTPWRAAVDPVYKKWEPIYGVDLIQQITDLSR